MKVKCIANGEWFFVKKKRNWLGIEKKRPTAGPKRGDIVTVKEEYWSSGEKYYRFIEWPDDNYAGFLAKSFVPIDDEKEKFEEVKFEKIKEKNPISIN